MRIISDCEELKQHHTAKIYPQASSMELAPRGTFFALTKDAKFSLASGSELQTKGLWTLRTNEPFSLKSGEILFGAESYGFSLPTALQQVSSMKGVLSYIDGCNNSVLISPFRDGDPCLNLMYMPPDIDQSWHTHPSFRFGTIIHGTGVAEWKEGTQVRSHNLKVGDTFLIEPMSLHHFKTEGSDLSVVIFHPDSEGGPKDHINPMFSRTYRDLYA